MTEVTTSACRHCGARAVEGADGSVTWVGTGAMHTRCPGHTAEAPTLAEFLLARIAEDEEWLALGFGCDLPHDGLVQKPDCRPRVLAECEAKRRIVEGAALVSVGDAPREQGHTDALRRVLMLMATPYADHPDFRAEWRG